jgi:hypothetical protein
VSQRALTGSSHSQKERARGRSRRSREIRLLSPAAKVTPRCLPCLPGDCSKDGQSPSGHQDPASAPTQCLQAASPASIRNPLTVALVLLCRRLDLMHLPERRRGRADDGVREVREGTLPLVVSFKSRTSVVATRALSRCALGSRTARNLLLLRLRTVTLYRRVCSPHERHSSDVCV